jgi:IstB-like ATP binding protein
MTSANKARTAALEALIDAHATELKLPTLRRQFRSSDASLDAQLVRRSRPLTERQDIRPGTVARAPLARPGTGKTMLATGLGVCACQQGRRVKFITLAALANELQEAVARDELSRVVARYAWIDVLLLDELGYLRLPDGAAELVYPSPFRTPRTRVVDRHDKPAVR